MSLRDERRDEREASTAAGYEFLNEQPDETKRSLANRLLGSTTLKLVVLSRMAPLLKGYVDKRIILLFVDDENQLYLKFVAMSAGMKSGEPVTLRGVLMNYGYNDDEISNIVRELGAQVVNFRSASVSDKKVGGSVGINVLAASAEVGASKVKENLSEASGQTGGLNAVTIVEDALRNENGSVVALSQTEAMAIGPDVLKNVLTTNRNIIIAITINDVRASLNFIRSLLGSGSAVGQFYVSPDYSDGKALVMSLFSALETVLNSLEKNLNVLGDSDDKKDKNVKETAQELATLIRFLIRPPDKDFPSLDYSLSRIARVAMTPVDALQLTLELITELYARLPEKPSDLVRELRNPYSAYLLDPLRFDIHKLTDAILRSYISRNTGILRYYILEGAKAVLEGTDDDIKQNEYAFSLGLLRKNNDATSLDDMYVPAEFATRFFEIVNRQKRAKVINVQAPAVSQQNAAGN